MSMIRFYMVIRSRSFFFNPIIYISQFQWKSWWTSSSTMHRSNIIFFDIIYYWVKLFLASGLQPYRMRSLRHSKEQILTPPARCLRKFHQPYIGVAILLIGLFDKYSEKSERTSIDSGYRKISSKSIVCRLLEINRNM